MPSKAQNTYGEVLTGGHITPRMRVAASLLAFGIGTKSVCRILHLMTAELKAWRQNPTFMALVHDTEDRHEQTVVEALLMGEMKAAARLMSLVDSSEEEVALKASLALLDRMGQRGKPVDKTEATQFVLQGDPQEMLNRALRDPGVRARMKDILAPALLPLPQPIEAEVVEECTSVSPTTTGQIVAGAPAPLADIAPPADAPMMDGGGTDTTPAPTPPL